MKATKFLTITTGFAMAVAAASPALAFDSIRPVKLAFDSIRPVKTQFDSIRPVKLAFDSIRPVKQG